MRLPLDEVAGTLREIGTTHMLPRLRALAADEVMHKAPGEIVTVVDRAVEALLDVRLPALLPGSRVIGEEAVAADPRLLDGLGEGLVWIVDPLDGTANFAAGRDQFASMVGLLRDGEPIAAWIHAPVTGSLAVAEAGAGTRVDGMPVRVVENDALPAVIKGRFLPQHFKDALAAVPAARLQPAEGSGAAGIDYPDFLRGRWRALMYWRTLAWDHVPGTLLAREAGAHVARFDGSPWHPADGRTGLLVAPGREAWERVRSCFPAD